MSDRLLILGTDADDALSFVTTDRPTLAKRKLGARIELVWPTAFMRIAKSDPFDAVILTPNMSAFPDQGLVDNWVKVCMLRVKGADGRTFGERLVAGEA
jgi:hypothetical protein